MIPKYNSITTHWNNYNRKWDESNLWDSWFRMQTLARIEIYSDYKNLMIGDLLIFQVLVFMNI